MNHLSISRCSSHAWVVATSPAYPLSSPINSNSCSPMSLIRCWPAYFRVKVLSHNACIFWIGILHGIAGIKGNRWRHLTDLHVHSLDILLGLLLQMGLLFGTQVWIRRSRWRKWQASTRYILPSYARRWSICPVCSQTASNTRPRPGPAAGRICRAGRGLGSGKQGVTQGNQRRRNGKATAHHVRWHLTNLDNAA